MDSRLTKNVKCRGVDMNATVEPYKQLNRDQRSCSPMWKQDGSDYYEDECRYLTPDADRKSNIDVHEDKFPSKAPAAMTSKEYTIAPDALGELILLPKDDETVAAELVAAEADLEGVVLTAAEELSKTDVLFAATGTGVEVIVGCAALVVPEVHVSVSIPL
ncbi:uncharacterized protein PV09_03583 [Verruconis gallopava]|uniref:Uncharacterized protein n=1 Tax=Verruconis gallopava TaxID=253628 RepID=A0A0D1XSJ2_9PEZI|nr:uncharacterized protein PV09_03583 [Verruconis gallopava]KIW05726.1 hypothetical protein PV09_03583 [Verruconis gallopava]